MSFDSFNGKIETTTRYFRPVVNIKKQSADKAFEKTPPIDVWQQVSGCVATDFGEIYRYTKAGFNNTIRWKAMIIWQQEERATRPQKKKIVQKR